MDNNPIYASAVSILAVFLLFFIIIGNLWTIQGEYYAMSNPYDGYLADDYGNFEFSQKAIAEIHRNMLLKLG